MSGNASFGQWQRAAYGRWKNKIRSATFGKHRGSKAADVIGDSLAAVLAGAAVFGFGFASGSAWAGTRWSTRTTRNRVKNTGTRGNGRPRQPAAGRPTAGAPPRPRPRPNAGGSTTPPRDADPGDSEVIDAELLDDPAPQTAASPYTAADDFAEVIGTPELLAHYPTAPNGATMADEIHNIHVLFDFSKTVIIQASETVNEAQIRKNSAAARADQAAIRSTGAGTRAEQASMVAATAAGQATQLEATAARFGALNMDGASLASIATATESGNALARAERVRAEREAIAAAAAATLANAEADAAAAADASANAAMMYVESVQNMHDTVQTHQMPHAEAQAATGNAAAHESILAAS